MKTKTINFFILLLFLSQLTAGQYEDFRFMRKITGITETWHKIILPDEIYPKLTSSLTDIRIIGITKNQDTIEAPYIFEELSELIIQNPIEYKSQNFTRQGNIYYYTFEVNPDKIINQIDLKFEDDNFDRQLKLEGGNKPDEWFTILDNYRILSINTSHTKYCFSSIKFQDTKYRYYRIFFASDITPRLNSAEITDQKIVQGVYRNYEIQHKEIINDKKFRQTIVKVDLPAVAPVSFIKIEIKENYDFYRPVDIQYLTDSSESPKGMLYNYSTIYSGVISSFEPNEFKFQNTFAHKLRIIIRNYDNEPLTISNINVKGNMHQLIARITTPADYYLLYGNENISGPFYDITIFKDKVPNNLQSLTLGPEELYEQNILKTVKPLFDNKLWLWIIMAVIILLLSVFTIKMMKN